MGLGWLMTEMAMLFINHHFTHMKYDVLVVVLEYSIIENIY